MASVMDPRTLKPKMMHPKAKYEFQFFGLCDFGKQKWPSVPKSQVNIVNKLYKEKKINSIVLLDLMMAIDISKCVKDCDKLDAM